MKCAVCNASVKKVIKNGDEYYQCVNGHVKARVKLSNKGLMMNGQAHVTVGAIILKDESVLLLNRRKYPFGYTIPAGHLMVGEAPLTAVKREVLEETGLDLSFELIKHEPPFYDPCKNSEVDYHEWYLYKARYNNGELRGNDESKEIRFVPFNELSDLKLTIPTKKFLSELSKTFNK